MMKCQPKQKKIVERPVFCFDFGIFSFFSDFFCVFARFFSCFFFVMGWDGGAGQGVCVCVEFVCDRSPDIRNTADPRNKEKCFFFLLFWVFFRSFRRSGVKTEQHSHNNKTSFYLVLPSFRVCVFCFSFNFERLEDFVAEISR